uniref:Uncharacterized protein n=1 Tax=Prolemur simus TaxID=1328070 RepID=A0A8C9AVC6_PROSS
TGLLGTNPSKFCLRMLLSRTYVNFQKLQQFGLCKHLVWNGLGFGQWAGLGAGEGIGSSSLSWLSPGCCPLPTPDSQLGEKPQHYSDSHKPIAHSPSTLGHPDLWL